MPIFRSDPDELDELDESPAPPPLPNDPRLAIAPDNRIYLTVPTGSYWMATSGEKLVAYLLDGVLVFVFTACLLFFIARTNSTPNLFRAVLFVLIVLYFWLMFLLKGATLGQLLFGLKFITFEGRNPHVFDASLKYIRPQRYAGCIYMIKVSKDAPPPPSSRPNVVQPTEYRQQPQPSHNPPAPRKFVYESRRVVLSNKDYKATSSQDETNEQR